MFYWALFLLLAGLIVVALELFIPSAGILGVVAAILIISAIVLGFMHDLTSGAFLLMVAVVALPALLGAMFKIWPHTPLGKRILLKDLKPEDILPNKSHYQKRNASLVGQLGIAKTKMLPSGIVIVDGEKYDAISEGFAIDAGDPIKIIAVREHRIYVQPFSGDAQDSDEMPVRDRDILSQPIQELGIDPIDDPLS
ncbi:MAG: NfeD family protein [Mariniblastus sp.]|nr:NfeD family protein [Mariniblastus sp.]